MKDEPDPAIEVHCDRVGKAAERLADRLKRRYGVSAMIVYHYHDPMSDESGGGAVLRGEKFALAYVAQSVIDGM